jgi:hypothetical protein
MWKGLGWVGNKYQKIWTVITKIEVRNVSRRKCGIGTEKKFLLAEKKGLAPQILSFLS